MLGLKHGCASELRRRSIIRMNSGWFHKPLYGIPSVLLLLKVMHVNVMFEVKRCLALQKAEYIFFFIHCYKPWQWKILILIYSKIGILWVNIGLPLGFAFIYLFILFESFYPFPSVLTIGYFFVELFFRSLCFFVVLIFFLHLFHPSFILHHFLPLFECYHLFYSKTTNVHQCLIYKLYLYN